MRYRELLVNLQIYTTVSCIIWPKLRHFLKHTSGSHHDASANILQSHLCLAGALKHYAAQTRDPEPQSLMVVLGKLFKSAQNAFWISLLLGVNILKSPLACCFQRVSLSCPLQVTSSPSSLHHASSSLHPDKKIQIL